MKTRFQYLLLMLVLVIALIPEANALELNPFADSKNFKPIPTEDMSNYIKEDFNKPVHYLIF